MFTSNEYNIISTAYCLSSAEAITQLIRLILGVVGCFSTIVNYSQTESCGFQFMYLNSSPSFDFYLVARMFQYLFI